MFGQEKANRVEAERGRVTDNNFLQSLQSVSKTQFLIRHERATRSPPLETAARRRRSNGFPVLPNLETDKTPLLLVFERWMLHPHSQGGGDDRYQLGSHFSHPRLRRACPRQDGTPTIYQALQP